MYQHTQTGTVIRWALLSGSLLLGGLALLLPPGPGALAARSICLSALVLLIAVAVAFHSLTISVTEESLTWSFGPGVFRNSVAVSEILDAEPTRTAAYDGWGIHLTARGWLYNVSGREAVWVRLRSGQQFLLGTDEPEQLATALRTAQRWSRA